MSPVTRLLAVVAAASILVTTPLACSLDWQVRPDPGAPPDAAGTEAGDAPSDSAVGDAPADGPAGDAAECDPLLAEVAAKKPLARACQLGQTGQCTTTVKDECDCNVVVRLAADPTTDAYVAAVAAYRAACSPSCAACPQLPPTASWACLQNGGVIECFP